MRTLKQPPAWLRFVLFLLKPWLRRISLTGEEVDRLRALSERGCVVFLMRTASMIDYLAWLWLTRRYRLPQPRIVFGLGKPSDLTCPEPEDGSLVFLKHTQAQDIDPIEGLIRQLRNGAASQVYLVPLSCLWGLKPRSMERSLLEIVLGGRAEDSRLRKLFWLLLRTSQTRVLVADEIVLHDFVADAPDQHPQTLSRKVRLSVRYHLAREERSVLGPRLLSRKRILDRVLRDRELRTAMAETAETENRPRTDVERDAAKILDEIAANYHWPTIRFLSLALTRIWSRIYEDFQVDHDGLERVREAAKSGPVVLVPSHKSHVDYLILSYTFKINDIPPPHIAAGENLSFFPLGPIFRRGGAFFLRRSFLGDKLYETALKTYIKVLLREDYNLEFFIEGTRSRSGKVMPPKFGILSMINDADAQLKHADCTVVPVSIDYESLVEEASIVREAAGGEKQPENVGGLLKARRTLNKKYGSVYVRFGEPLILRELRARYHDLPHLEQVKRIAYDTTEGILQTVTVTSTSLVATALAVHHKRGIRREVLLERLELLEAAVRRQGAVFASDFLYGTLDPERALTLFVQNKVVRKIELQGEEVYSVPDDKRLALDYYKNNIVHHMVNLSFAALAFRICDRDTFDSLWQGYCELHQIFAEEFHRVYRPPTKDELRGELAWLAERGLIEQVDEFWRVKQPIAMLGLENVTRNFLESAYIMVLALLESEKEPQARETRDWLKLAMEMGDLLYAKGDVWRTEARNKVNLQVTLNSFRHSKVLVESEAATGRRGRPLYHVTESAYARLEHMHETFRTILSAVEFN